MLIFYDVMFQIYGFQLFHSAYYYGYNKLYNNTRARVRASTRARVRANKPSTLLDRYWAR